MLILYEVKDSSGVVCPAVAIGVQVRNSTIRRAHGNIDFGPGGHCEKAHCSPTRSERVRGPEAEEN